MTKTFGVMHVIVTGIVKGEEEEPTGVKKPDQVGFDMAKVGRER